MKSFNVFKTILNIARNKFKKRNPELLKWKKDNAENTLRINYNLNNNSLIFDVGGYHGQWADDIFLKYGSNIIIFEPVKSFYEIIKNKFSGNNKISIYNYGLSNIDGAAEISLENDSSSLYKKSKNATSIKLKGVTEFIKQNKIAQIDLMKINIEGGEYSLLEELIKTGDVKKIFNIQVQFHDFVPNAKQKMIKIQNDLKKTHHLTYQYEFVWENWQINN